MQIKTYILSLLCGLLLNIGFVYAAGLDHYSDYGVVEQTSSANSGSISISNDPFGYSDEYTDSESGLQYLQVRYYNPTIMRFTQMDSYPLLNRYAYASENPIMDDDPSGHSAIGASRSSASNFGETTAGSFTGALAYYGVMEICNSVISAAFPGLGEVSFLLTQIPINTGALVLSTVGQSLVTTQSLSGKQVATAAVGGAIGGIFAAGMSMVETPLLHDTEGLGLNRLTTKAVTDMSSQVGQNAGVMLSNTMFGIKNHFTPQAVYFTGMMLSLGAVNTGFIMDDGFASSYENEAETAQKSAESNNKNTSSLSVPESSNLNMGDSAALESGVADPAPQEQLGQKSVYNNKPINAVKTYDLSIMLFHIGFRTIYGTATSYIGQTSG